MKVYLLNPPVKSGSGIVREGRCMQRKGAWTTVWPPISLCYCASLLVEDGFQVKINDCSAEESSMSDIKKVLSDFKPDVVILNTATVSIANDLSFSTIAKSILPDVKIAALGVHVSVLPEESFIMQPDLDFVIRGEPEITTLELCKAIRDNKKISTVKGISLAEDGKILHNKSRPFLDDLDSLPYPAWNLINTKNYLVPLTGKPFLLLMTSKGCPYNCVFCPAEPYYGKKIRMRKPEKIVDEIEWLQKKFNVKNMLFWAELFTIQKNFVLKLCQEISKRNLEVKWVCNSRVDTVDLEMLKAMKKAGCWMIGYGIESGNQEILNKSKKGVTLRQIESAVENANKARIEVTAHAIFGLPGETRKTAEETITLLKKLDLDYIQAYCAVPWPGTKLYDIAKEKNWITRTDWSYFEQNNSVMRTQELSPPEIEALRRKALKSFYLRPKLIYKTLKKIKSPQELKNFAHMIKDFKTWV